MNQAGSNSLPKASGIARYPWRFYVNGWSVSTVVVAVVVLLPMLLLGWKALFSESESWNHVAQNLLGTYLSNTGWISIGVAFFTLVLGVIPAWLVSAYEFKGRAWFEWLLILPLAIPAYILAFTYAGLLDYTGPIQTFYRNVLEMPSLWVPEVMNRKGVIFVLSLALYPYVFIMARTTFSGQSRVILETSRLLGKGPWQTFWQVALPLARPAVFGALFLVLMEVLNDYGTVKYFGVDTFTTGIFRAWFSLGDATTAVQLSLILLGFVLLLLGIERWQRGRARFDDKHVNAKRLVRFSLSKKGEWMAVIVCAIPLIFGFILPVLQLLAWAWKTYSTFFTGAFWALIGNSFLLALVASLLAVVISIVLVYAVRVSDSTAVRTLSRMSIMGYSIPGAIIAVGVLVVFSYADAVLHSFWIQVFLTGSLIGVVYAYVVRFLAVAYSPIRSGFETQCKHTDEAARMLGASPMKALLQVNLPIATKTLISAGILVFIDLLKELPLTLILRPFNFNTLATKAFEMADTEMVAEAAPASLIILLTGMIPVLVLHRIMGKQHE